MNKYVYNGPVMQFGMLIAERWQGETMAPTEKKARSNLIYKFKINHNLIASSKIELPGKIKLVE